MRVTLAYGRTGLDVDLPAGRVDLVTPHHPRPLADPQAAVVAALEAPVGTEPLRSRVRPGQQVVVSVCDGTRAQPREVMLAALLQHLDGVLDPADLTVLIATGTHRANTDAELREMLGDAVVDRCRVVNHDARDESSLAFLGESADGVPVWVNRLWVDADVRVTTGFVEPHFFAGFSGGPKMVTPGLAGLETVKHLHDIRRIGHPDATWGRCIGNPVHDSIRAAAAMCPPDLSCDVLLDDEQRVTRAFAGELFAMHQQARRAARKVAMHEVAEPYDVVVTTNSGFPLDQNLYQAVKGMAAAERVVRDGGTIVLAAECSDGLPDHGSYAEMLGRAADVTELVALFGDPDAPIVPDQWTVQVQARIQARARVRVHASGLSDQELSAAHLEPAPDVAAAVDEALSAAGRDARVCVLPEGPQTIPYLVGT
jgi:nickel-dependent lactate racemase